MLFNDSVSSFETVIRHFFDLFGNKMLIEVFFGQGI